MTSLYRLSRHTTLAVSLLAFATHPCRATDCSTPISSFGTSIAGSFNITMSGFSSSQIQQATAYWNCPGYSSYIPLSRSEVLAAFQ